MSLPYRIALLAIAAVVLSLTRHSPAQEVDNKISRGQYLAVSAGQCSDCHGPRLQGAPLAFLKPGLPVLYRSPKIAGLPQRSVADAARFLETGVLPNGEHARPPMPQYRFDHDDATAIVAYLKSLK